MSPRIRARWWPLLSLIGFAAALYGGWLKGGDESGATLFFVLALACVVAADIGRRRDA
jgi:hypothetical protein